MLSTIRPSTGYPPWASLPSIASFISSFEGGTCGSPQSTLYRERDRGDASVLGWGSGSSDDGGSYAFHLKDLDVLHVTFTRPDLTRLTRLNELGLEVVGQHVESKRAVLARRVVDDERA